MAKLNIEYRLKDDEKNIFKGQTYQTISFESKIATLSISPNETRKLKEMVEGLIEDLKNRTYFDKDEQIEIDEFDRMIMKIEETQEERICNKVYNVCKVGYQGVLDGKVTIDDLINQLEEERICRMK